MSQMLQKILSKEIPSMLFFEKLVISGAIKKIFFESLSLTFLLELAEEFHQCSFLATLKTLHLMDKLELETSTAISFA